MLGGNAAPCNGAAQETTTRRLQFSGSMYGLIFDLEVTTEFIYFSMFAGERFKINRTSSSIIWAVDYGTYGHAMALSSDQSFLLAGSYFSSSQHLGKLSSSDGSVLASYSTSLDFYYQYILVSDSRALCMVPHGWF